MRTVSVVIPCYNYGHYLPACVGSVLSQPGVDVEVLVIDDCSSDDSAAAGEALAVSDARVSFRRHEVNRGHIATYNEGIEWATGDYLVLLSADDLLTDGALGRAATALESDPGVGFVYGRSLYFESNDDLPPARTGLAQPQLWPGRDWIARRCRTATSCISSPEVVVRTSLQHELGGYRRDLPHAGDVEMWLRFAAHSDVVYLRQVDQAYYRKHPSSMMRTTFASPIADLRQRQAAFDAMFALHGSSVRDGTLLHDEARRALAREALWKACRGLDRRRLDLDEADELVAFAVESYPGTRSLPGYWAFRGRRRLGPRWSPWLQPVLVTPYVHRIRDRLWWRRWREFGV